MSSVLRRPDAFALDSHTRDEIALFLAKAALAAGPAVMEEYDRGCEVASKADGSPVTSADHRAEVIICDYLARMIPRRPYARRRRWRPERASSRRAFPAGRSARRNAGIPRGQRRVYDQCRSDGEWRSDRRRGVCARNRPTVGWRRHSVRVRDAASAAELPDEGSRRRIQTRRAPSSLVAFASRSHLDAQSDAFLKGLPIGETRFAGSSLKFCLIAEGLGDVYPRFAPTMEWDTAAGDAVLRAAGGAVLDPSGRAAFVRQDRERFAQRPFHRLGRSDGRQAVRILKSSQSHLRAIN